jgi:hypothetical protein
VTTPRQAQRQLKRALKYKQQRNELVSHAHRSAVAGAPWHSKLRWRYRNWKRETIRRLLAGTPLSTRAVRRRLLAEMAEGNRGALTPYTPSWMAELSDEHHDGFLIERNKRNQDREFAAPGERLGQTMARGDCQEST